MKVLYSHYLAADEHPAARMVASISDQLRGFGHDVLIHASRFEGVASVQTGPSRGGCPGVGSWLRGRLWFAKAMARDRRRRAHDLDAIERFQPDVVLARQDAYRSSMAWAARRSGVPLVTYADAPVAHEVRTYGDGGRWHPSGVVESVERRTLRASRCVVTVSHPAAEILGRYRLATPIHVVPNGVDPRRFPEIAPDERIRRRESLGIREPIVVGFQGTFKPFHGLDRLRELILRTSDRPDVRWLLIGDGPGLPSLRESVEGRGRVTFLGRRKPEEMGGLLSLVDVAVAPHEMNAGPFYFSPLKILEYAAAGCAILASEQGDIPAMLDRGRVATLMRDGDLDCWTRALLALLDDEPRRRTLGREARRWVMENRTWRDTASAVDQSLFAACERRESPGVVPDFLPRLGT